jgi:hypothetical protein
MCDPGTLAIASAVMAVAGTAASTMSQVSQYRYEARVADFNRKAEDAKVQDAAQRGQIEERNAARRQSALMGAQRAAMAANGIDLSFGSAAETLGDSAMMAQEDRGTIRENTRREQMGYDINAANYAAKAKAARSAATGAIWSGIFQAGSTIAGAASRLGSIKAGKTT